jgi:hypothetical protein
MESELGIFIITTFTFSKDPRKLHYFTPHKNDKSSNITALKTIAVRLHENIKSEVESITLLHCPN